MNIAKALKVKSRLVSKLALLDNKFKYNTHENSNQKVTSDDWAEYKAVQTRLVEVKAAIAKANAGILDKLELQAQLKAEIVLLNSLSTTILVQQENVLDKSVAPPIWVPTKKEIKPYLSIDEQKSRIAKLTTQIEDLQDEIDDYNGKTKVKVSE